MTPLCAFGSATDSPCLNEATGEGRGRILVCDLHRDILTLGELLDRYAVASELIEETIEKAEALGPDGETTVRLLGEALREAKDEVARLEQEMEALEP